MSYFYLTIWVYPFHIQENNCPAGSESSSIYTSLVKAVDADARHFVGN